MLAKAHVVAAGGKPSPLPPGPPLALPLDVDAYMAQQRSAALLILHDGRLRLERYGLGFDRDGRWTSFSVAKSITSTLLGAAVRDGKIRSLDDKVSDYIQEMKGSAYDEVSVRQLLTMTSGVRWNEDYANPDSDVARSATPSPRKGVDALVSYLRKLPRACRPATRWNYSTGETNLVGVLVSQATGKPLASYLSEKIWVPAGMEQQATWLLSRTGQEISGCCIAGGRARLRALRAASSSTARVPAGSPWSRTAGWPKATSRPGRHRAAPAAATASSGGPTTTATLRGARHLRPGHLHRSEAQAGDRLQRRLGGRGQATVPTAWRERTSTRRWCARRSTTKAAAAAKKPGG